MSERQRETWIRIRIVARDGGAPSYPVEVSLADGSFFGDGSLSIDTEELLALELEPETYGLKLSAALFTGAVRRAWDKASGLAQARSDGRLRVLLQIDDGAPELHALRWERLYHHHQGRMLPLAASEPTPFARFTGLELERPEPLTALPLRMLVVLANPRRLPRGLAPIDVEQEIASITTALGDLRRTDQVRVTLLPGRSGLSTELRERLETEGYQFAEGAASLQNILRRLGGAHVLHVVAHGAFERGAGAGGSTALLLERDDGTSVPVPDSRLVRRLAAKAPPPPQLVFLAACETAGRETGAPHPFVGLAPRLVRAGVPAVVAMQDRVEQAMATELSAAFYQQLTEHGSVDLALNQARWLLLEGRRDWSVPVLFSRLEHGRLFREDPVRTALHAIYADEGHHPWAEGEYMPLEVTGPGELGERAGLEAPGDLGEPSVDLVEASLGLLRDAERIRLAVLVGDAGTAKSTHLRRMMGLIAQRSLDAGQDDAAIPVYLNLENLRPRKTSAAGPLESLIHDSLVDWWPSLTPQGVSRLLRSRSGPRLFLLADGSDVLPDEARARAWRALRSLAWRHPRHLVLVAVRSSDYDPEQLESDRVLLIRPLMRHKVESFLGGLSDRPSGELLEALKRARLFDLASIPWLLGRMLQQAREGSFPTSRSQVLDRLLQDALSCLPTRRGLRFRARPTLYALALEAQSKRRTSWVAGDMLELMAGVRGRHEYCLEDLNEALVSCGPLARVGTARLRFAYPSIQAYCCARAILTHEDREPLLDDIIATLGRFSRLHWWEETLLFLSSLLADPTQLVRNLLYDANLSEGDQLFLAARCLLEADPRQVDPELANQMVRLLIWRLDWRNEPIPARRIRAAEALGLLGQIARFGRAEMARALARVATQPVRLDWRQEPDYELSGVRLAAVQALRGVAPKLIKPLESEEPLLWQLLGWWRQGAVEALAECLRSGHESIQPLAALALGEMATGPAAACLIEAFHAERTEGGTRWAVADALLRLDPTEVRDRAVLPVLDRDHARRVGLDDTIWKRRRRLYERVAYLIGRARIRHEITASFLGRCIHEFTDVWMKGRAIRALGRLSDASYRPLFEEVATGKLGRLELRKGLGAETVCYLRRKALIALSDLGDEKTLKRLQRSNVAWNPELRRTLFWTMESISWRLRFREHREPR